MNRRPACWLVLPALCCAPVLGGPAAAERARWDLGREIPLWVEHVKVPEDHVEMVRRAGAAWSRGSAGALRFTAAGEFPSTGIRVRFVRDEENFGEAMPYVDRRTGRIVRADVVLLMDPPGDRLHKQLVVYLSALHELGHALGLPHHDEFGNIMYRFRRPADPERFFLGYRNKLRSPADIGTEAASGLTREDIAALLRLYAP